MSVQFILRTSNWGERQKSCVFFKSQVFENSNLVINCCPDFDNLFVCLILFVDFFCLFVVTCSQFDICSYVLFSFNEIMRVNYINEIYGDIHIVV